MGDSMSSIVISGDTSGAITIAAPAVAGTNTLSLPAVTGTVVTTGSSAVVTQAMLSTNVASNGPAFSAYITSNQSISASTWTKVALATKEFDTNSNFDNATNYRFTPTVAGYYQINCGLAIAGDAFNSISKLSLYKNGSAYKGTMLNLSGNYLNYGYMNLSTVVYCNGSTDYIELYGWTNLSSNPAFYTNDGTAMGQSTFMSGSMVRAA